MNEQLQAKLVEILAGIQAATKTAGDFAMEQLPDIAQQYVAYGRAASVLWIAFWLLAMLVSAYTIRRFIANERAAGHRSTGGWATACMPVGTVCAGSAIGTVISIQSAALVWFAPKVWLLKELASLIK